MRKPLAALAVAAFLLTGCSAEPEPDETNPYMPQVIRYEVETSNGKTIPAGKPITADLTISTADGTEQATVALPLKSKDGSIGYKQSFLPGNFVSISAQKGDYYGDITCRIVTSDIGGGTETVLSENTSSGQYAVVSCSGMTR